MITRMSHTTIYVLDQDVAYDFYVNKLGFTVHTDAKMGEFRWLTVCPKGQPDLEIVLMPIGLDMGGSGDPEVKTMMKKLLEKGALGSGVFDTPNLEATYQELKAKGVEFLSAPEQKFYGKEAIFKDPFGNFFSLGEKPEAK
ncbi:MAG: VOC family protein [Bacteroidota bacterium]